MDQISNQQTQASYVNALTLGPSNYDSITAQIFNATAVYQVFSLGNDGDYQTGDWGTDLYAVASEQIGTTLNISKCGGIRLKTNPATPSTPARVNAWAWKDGEPQIVGLTGPAGTLGSGGAVTGGSVITGIVAANGTVTAGTGFTVNHSGTGIYVISFTTAFTSTPVVSAIAGPGSPDASTTCVLTAAAAGSVTIETIRQATGVLADSPFNFAAQAVV